MLGLPVFYNQTIRKMVTIFGTLFNDIVIDRVSETGVTISSIEVPISYGPKQKYLAKLANTNDKHLMTLPRISFEITDMSFDTERQLNKLNKIKWIDDNDNTIRNYKFMPVPYNFSFQLAIMVLNAEDGTRIIEQILPFFTPEFNVSAKLIDGVANIFDMPIVLEGISIEDIYEGTFEERRTLVWTLDFVMKGWLFGPAKKRGVIRDINVNMFDGIDAADNVETINIVPGIKGQTNVDPDLVSVEDDFVGIVTINTDNTN